MSTASNTYCVIVADRAGERDRFEFATFERMLAWVKILRSKVDPNREATACSNLDHADVDSDGLTDEEREAICATEIRADAPRLEATPEIMLEQALLISIEATQHIKKRPEHVHAAHWCRESAKLHDEAARFLRKAAEKIDAAEKDKVVT